MTPHSVESSPALFQSAVRSHEHCPSFPTAWPSVAPVMAPEIFLCADLSFVHQTGLLGGSHLRARRWARMQERKQRQWSAIDVRLHTAHVCGARDSHSKTPDCSQHERQDRLHWMRIRANEMSHHSSVNVSDHTIQFQNSAAPSKWKPGC